jgi:aldose 1-epimerase
MKNRTPLHTALLLASLLLAGCGDRMYQPKPPITEIPGNSTPLLKKPFGQTSDGQPVDQFILTTAKGSSARFISYGATLTNLFVPDKNNHLGDVVLGYDTVNQYEISIPSMCCMVGRFANRIGNATFTIQDPRNGNKFTYHLSANQGPNTLHGGFKGLGKRNWKGDMGMTPDGPAVRFTILDPDGAEGFPGNLTVTVIYTLTNDDALKMQFLATTDKPTPINLSQHAYFNLSGNQTGDNTSYVAHFNAISYLPMNAALVPTGEILPVAGTPFDFTHPKLIGRDLSPLPGKPPGYDHTLVLNNKDANFIKAGEVYDPVSGRLFECFTTEPAIHFTNGRNLAGVAGKNGVTYSPYRGFTLETQHFSDSPNHANFPTTILNPGETYHQLSEYKFSIPKQPLLPE